MTGDPSADGAAVESEETPAEDGAAEETPAEDGAAEETPAEDGAAEETPAEDGAAEVSTTQTAVQSAALAAAIEENPEAVATFVRRLDAVNELLDVLSLGENALDDEMVTSLAGTGSRLAESADGLATDETVTLAETVGANAEELSDAMETLVQLQRSGTLEELSEIAEVGSLATAALDDEMITSLAGTGAALGEVADTASEPETRDGIERLLESVGDAETESPEPVGAVGLVRSLRDPEVKQGLGYLLAVARALGRTQSEQ
jgi:uncharacterized protein YjgD (DUF1641 family)